MDMAIQRRENDLVLGTHGRSIYVIDDYSALRGLETADFNTDLQILSATPGQLYGTNPTASTRFTGSGEYRGDNEPYGAMVTFMASGDDLPLPDAERERQRLIDRRARDGGGEEADGQPAKPVKVRVSVMAPGDEVVRTFTQAAYQGINRVTWDMHADGVRPAPSNEPPQPDEDLPAGAEMPPGRYTLTLELAGRSDSIEVETLADPRSALTRADYQARFEANMATQDLQAALVSSLEQIVAIRADLDTLSRLVAQRDKSAGSDGESELAKRIKSVRGQLDELEQRFRVPPQTTGITYDDDKVSSKLAMANAYLSASPGAPSRTAAAYVEQARTALDDAQQALADFERGGLASLRQAIIDAGIGLLQPPSG
jgi:hypothetical protein